MALPSSRNRRSGHRQSVRYKAWIAIGQTEPFPCELLDISASGARLGVGAADAFDAFVLLLTEDGQHRRYCKVVWRSSKGTGVRFVEPGDI